MTSGANEAHFHVGAYERFIFFVFFSLFLAALHSVLYVCV